MQKHCATVPEAERVCKLRLSSGWPCSVVDLVNSPTCRYRCAKSLNQAKKSKYPLYFDDCIGGAPLTQATPDYDANACSAIQLDPNNPGQFLEDPETPGQFIHCNGMEENKAAECKLGSFQQAVVTTCPDSVFEQKGSPISQLFSLDIFNRYSFIFRLLAEDINWSRM